MLQHTVQAGAHQQQQPAARQPVGGPNSEVESKCWAKMWKVQVPSKLKVLLCRLAEQSLPTADLLHHRNMATTPTSILCGAFDSWKHSLLECAMISPRYCSQFGQFRWPDAKRIVMKPTQPVARGSRSWLDPPSGFYKITVDGAMPCTSNQGMVGAICQNQQGIFMGAATVFPGISDPNVLKTLACSEALALA
ncbi:uncharacterized protein LOC124683532 isoform X2 [Lolium rigidum]|uniref:uncharacterized protein LOC124683532 isoform X2 n=1 Tax=Lolium rigidum TaxID=89674 RepID=UPI001F5E3288|nr:uncharacterized protein LOC124683532 isoform X2 [Lolium rigidum]